MSPPDTKKGTKSRVTSIKAVSKGAVPDVSLGGDLDQPQGRLEARCHYSRESRGGRKAPSKACSSHRLGGVREDEP